MLNKRAIIPPILSTADDISTAFHIAVNGPETTLSCPDIGWSFAEAVLERFSFLWTKELEKVGNDVTKSTFGKAVWRTNNFDSNMVKLLNGGDCWRLRKSLELLVKMVGDPCDLPVSVEIFESLASILLQPDEDVEWAYLIAKNQKIAVDHGVLRLINSFLYSRKEKRKIFCNVLEIIKGFANDEVGSSDNTTNFCLSEKVPEALIKILVEENGDDVIEIGLEIVFISSLNYFGEFENISILIDAGLLEALVKIFNSPLKNKRFIHFIVGSLLSYDEHFIEEFHELGIPVGSSFFEFEI
jgi:hypothetical protein